MGFGSYDESERENRELDSDLDDGAMDAAEATHDGEVEFEIGASSDELLDRLEEIKD